MNKEAWNPIVQVVIWHSQFKSCACRNLMQEFPPSSYELLLRREMEATPCGALFTDSILSPLHWQERIKPEFLSWSFLILFPPCLVYDTIIAGKSSCNQVVPSPRVLSCKNAWTPWHMIQRIKIRIIRVANPANGQWCPLDYGSFSTNPYPYKWSFYDQPNMHVITRQPKLPPNTLEVSFHSCVLPLQRSQPIPRWILLLVWLLLRQYST